MLVRYLRQIDREKYDPSVLSLLALIPLERHIADLSIKNAAIGMSESHLSLAALSNLRRKYRNPKPDSSKVAAAQQRKWVLTRQSVTSSPMELLVRQLTKWIFVR